MVRYPKTANEKRQATSDEGLIRAKRKFKIMDRLTWDGVITGKQRCWKKYRHTKWLTNVSLPL